jgi:hypothetical protein
MKNFLHLSHMASRGSLLFLFLTIFSTTLLNGATVTAIASGNWSAIGTWDINTVPTSADDVVIPNGFTVTLDVAGLCNTLTINGSGSLAGSSTTLYTLSVYGATITINGTGTLVGYNGANDFGIALGNGGTAGQTLTITGNSSATNPAKFNRITPTANTLTLNIDINTELRRNANSSSILTINSKPGFTVNINASKTLNVLQGYISVSGSSSSNAPTAAAAGDFTINVYGTVTTNAGNVSISNIPNSTDATSKTTTIHVYNGGVFTMTTGALNGLNTTSGGVSQIIVESGGQFNSGTGSVTLGTITTGTTTTLVSSLQILGTGSFISNTTSTRAYGNLDISSGATFTPCASGATSYSVTGNFSTALSAHTGKTITLNGASNQNINANGNTITPLTLNNAAGATLTGNLTVTGVLTLTSGKLTLGANTLTIGSAGSISGATSAKYVVTDGAGGLILPIPASTATTAFPIGTATTYRSASVQYTAAPTAGTLKGRFVASAPSTTGLPITEGASTIEYVSPTGYWEMTAGPTDGTYTMTVDASGFTKVDGATAISTLVGARLIKRPTGGSWAATATTTTTDPGSLATLAAAGLMGFSDFALGGPAAVLPVELMTFTANAHGNANLLNWSTASEKENAGFNIERSADGQTFTTLGTVKGHGTTQQINHYQFTDANPLRVNYYRLNQVDNNGKNNLSKIVSLANGVTKGSVKIYPTLVSDVLSVETTDIETAMIQIMDVTGRIVLTQPLQQSISVGSLPNGVYMAVFTSNKIVSTMKFVKM